MILLVHYSSQTLNKFVYRVANKDKTSEPTVRNLYCQTHDSGIYTLRLMIPEFILSDS